MAHILLVEDDQWMADCYRDWLHATHTTAHAHDAQGALDAAEERAPDAIVLDLFLPHANGIQLLHALQSHSDWARIPVILCSSSLPAQMPGAGTYGVRAVLDKASLTPRRLQQTIAEALDDAAL